jgi:hypothetical protein
MSVAEEIKRLHELHQAGALSDEEFAAAKARLLNSQSPASPTTSLVAPLANRPLARRRVRPGSHHGC